MASPQNPNRKTSLYPQIIESNPDPLYSTPSSSTPSNLYPKIDFQDLVENLFPESPEIPQEDGHAPPSAPPVDHVHVSPSAPPEAVEQVLIKIPGAIVNLIDKNYSVELASGDLSIVRLVQGDNVVAVLARLADEIQWPLAKDEAAVKLDDSHYFFSLRLPEEHYGSDSSDDEEKKRGVKSSGGEDNVLNYGLTIAPKGQENLLKEFDEILGTYSCFSVQKVSENAKELLDEKLAKEISPMDLKTEGKKKELMEGKCVAYWTTLAPNVEDYSGTAGKLIAAGSGQLIKGILWCGDVTMDRLNWGNEVMKKRMDPKATAEISPDTLKRIRRCGIDNLMLVLSALLFWVTVFTLNFPACLSYSMVFKSVHGSP